MVIHPSAARWENAPKIEAGSSVYKDQVLLLMPDLSRMQVKLGIHESRIDRIKPGLAARVTLPDRTLDGEVSFVASVTAPAGIWTGYKVEYETRIALPPVKGLKPGTSAEVEIIVDRHEDVLTLPVAAVVETADGDFCWVKTAKGVQRRSLELGDTDDVFTIVKTGLEEGDEVMLNPLAFMEAPEEKALKRRDEPGQSQSTSSESGKQAKPQESSFGTKPKPQKPSSEKAPNGSGKPKGSKPKATARGPETGKRETVVRTLLRPFSGPSASSLQPEPPTA